MSRAWLTWTDGRARVGRQARAAGGERRPAAGRNRGLGRQRARQNRDVTPAEWLTRDGRAGTSNPAAQRLVMITLTGDIYQPLLMTWGVKVMI